MNIIRSERFNMYNLLRKRKEKEEKTQLFSFYKHYINVYKHYINGTA